MQQIGLNKPCLKQKKNRTRTQDLAKIRDPYIALGFVVVTMFIIIGLKKMSTIKVEDSEQISFKSAISKMATKAKYREGVIAQAFYIRIQSYVLNIYRTIC